MKDARDHLIAMSCAAFTLMALLVADPVHAADETATRANSGMLEIANLAKEALSEKSFSVGIAYWQGTYKVRQQGAAGSAIMSDNGAISPTLTITSKERLLFGWPLITGNAVIGWDVNASIGFIDTKFQSISSGVRGTDIGTRVKGQYLGAAPTLFFKLGPISRERQVYWKLALGAGPGLMKASGTAAFGSSGATESVGSSSWKPALYTYGSVLVQVGQWEYGFTGRAISQMNDKPSYESYGLGVAYRFSW